MPEIFVMDSGRPDKRYDNVCVEHTNYAPVSIQDLVGPDKKALFNRNF